jgi:hypothetical protein
MCDRFGLSKHATNSPESVLAERDPNSPCERLGFAIDGNLPTAQDEELLLISNTRVGFPNPPAALILNWDRIEIQWRFGAESGHPPRATHCRRCT